MIDSNKLFWVLHIAKKRNGCYVMIRDVCHVFKFPMGDHQDPEENEKAVAILWKMEALGYVKEGWMGEEKAPVWILTRKGVHFYQEMYKKIFKKEVVPL